MSDKQFTGVWFCRGKHILCICFSLYDVCRLIERDVACTCETLLLLAYAVASLRPESHTCPETGFSGAQTAYIGHKMPDIVHNFNIVRKWTWNEWDFMSPVCTYRLNWARITSWGWWDEWDDTALQKRGDGGETFLFLLNRRDRGTNPVSAWKVALSWAPAPLYRQEHYWEQSNSPQDEFTWYMTAQ